MKKLLSLILSSASLLAIADDSGSGLYIGAGVGAGWNNQAAPATTFRLDGGWNFNQYWAIELGTTGLTQSGGAYNQNMQYYDLSVKGTVPIGDTVDLYAQVGGAYGSPGIVGGNVPTINFNGQRIPNPSGAASLSSWNFMSGVGVNLNFTKNWGINLSDLYYYGPSTGIQGNTNVLLVGLKYQM